MRAFRVISIVLLLCFVLVGCGETIKGIGRDCSRMGRGIKTFFGCGSS